MNIFRVALIAVAALSAVACVSSPKPKDTPIYHECNGLNRKLAFNEVAHPSGIGSAGNKTRLETAHRRDVLQREYNRLNCDAVLYD